jgi:DNA-binding transcriptional MocR family regulator
LATFVEREYEPFLETLRAEHRARRDALVGSLRAQLSNELGFHIPEGGLYLWCRLARDIGSSDLFQECKRHGLAIAKGGFFYPEPIESNHIRLCFSAATVEQIALAVEKLQAALHAVAASGVTRSKLPVA